MFKIGFRTRTGESTDIEWVEKKNVILFTEFSEVTFLPSKLFVTT